MAGKSKYQIELESLKAEFEILQKENEILKASPVSEIKEMLESWKKDNDGLRIENDQLKAEIERLQNESAKPRPKNERGAGRKPTIKDFVRAEIVRLHQTTDLTFVEIAEQVGVSYGTVRTTIKNNNNN